MINYEKTYYKVIHVDQTYNGNLYKIGLNELSNCINCSGLCFTDLNNLGTFYEHGNLIAVIKLCNDSMIVEDLSQR